MINLVLDTNIVFRDRLLNKPSMLLLESYLHATGSKLFIPKVVVEEVKNNFNKDIVETNKKFLDFLKSYKKITKESLIYDFSKDKQKDIFNEYCEKFDRRLKELDVNVVEYEGVEHTSIVQKSLLKSKPFKDNGDGYRDALIWQTLLTKIANNKSTTILITDHTRDFTSNRKDIYVLHSDLIKDLKSNNLDEKSVKIVSSIEDFIENYIKKKFKIEDLIRVQFQKPDKINYFTEWIDSHNDEILVSMNSMNDGELIKLFPAGERIYVEYPRIIYFSLFEDLDLDSILEIDKKTLFISYTTVIEAEIEFDVFRGNHGLFVELIDRSYSWTKDQSDYYTSFHGYVEVDAIFNFTFDRENNDIVDYEIEFTQTINT